MNERQDVNETYEVRFTPKSMETAPLDREVWLYVGIDEDCRSWVRGKWHGMVGWGYMADDYAMVHAWAELSDLLPVPAEAPESNITDQPPACSNTQNPNPEPTVEEGVRMDELDLAAQRAANILYNLAQRKELDQFDRSSCREGCEAIDRARRKSTDFRKQIKP